MSNELELDIILKLSEEEEDEKPVYGPKEDIGADDGKELEKAEGDEDEEDDDEDDEEEDDEDETETKSPHSGAFCYFTRYTLPLPTRMTSPGVISVSQEETFTLLISTPP